MKTVSISNEQMPEVLTRVGDETEVEFHFGQGVSLILPEDIHSKLMAGALDTNEAKELDNLLTSSGLINRELGQARTFAITDNLVRVEKTVAQVPINVEFKVHKFKLYKRTVYKELFLSAMVPSSEQDKWLALFGCIAGSSALTIWLAGIAFGPVGWATIAAAIISSAMVCLNEISPETLGGTDGSGEVRQNKGSWHRV